MFTNVTTSAYQVQLNAGFSKVCEIFKVHGIESLKYVREFYTLESVIVATLTEVGRVPKNCTQVKVLLEIFTQVKVKVID